MSSIITEEKGYWSNHQTISINSELKTKLASLGSKDETFDQIVQRLLDSYLLHNNKVPREDSELKGKKERKKSL